MQATVIRRRQYFNIFDKLADERLNKAAKVALRLFFLT
tara:strand:+ start:479 stop:592 length:114 start_codon:yes stop_codon:yes gene_type:complete